MGNQFGGRVGFFLEVKHFDVTYRHMLANGVAFARELETSHTDELPSFAICTVTSGISSVGLIVRHTLFLNLKQSTL